MIEYIAGLVISYGLAIAFGLTVVFAIVGWYKMIVEDKKENE